MIKIRIFYVCTGIITIISSLYLAVIYINSLFLFFTPPPYLRIIFTTAFIFSFLLKGICWLIQGWSDKPWTKP